MHGKKQLLSFLIVCLLLSHQAAMACPFCSAIDNTISEDLSKSDVTVVAEWMDTPHNRAALARGVPAGRRDEEDPLSLRDFQVIRIYKGESRLGGETKRVRATFRGRPEPNRVYLLFGFVDQSLGWAAALPLHRESLTYLDALPSLPKPGPERLTHFLQYLNHAESALADDAYNEFARAPYSDVKGMRSSLDRVWLLQRITDARTDARRRRLYLTLLGICGEPSDAPAVWQVMETLEDPKQLGLDAAIACYLSLTKTDGVAPIEERYFLRPKVEFKNVHSAIMALRFHGEEEHLIPRDRLCAALRRVLAIPQLADQVMADLARWQDWSAATQVAELFRTSTDANQFVRVPAARYLMLCPDPRAKQLLAELTKLDPDAVRRAKTFMPVPPPDARDSGTTDPD